MKTKTTHQQAMNVAQSLMAELAPLCERIAVAGSLRRMRPEVGDIELVAIAKPVLDLFGEPAGGCQITDWLTWQGIKPTKNGERYKQFEYGGYQVDLFLAQPDNWGLIYMIRTGSGDFSKKMMTLKAWGGYLPQGLKVDDGRLWRSGAAIAVPSEDALFGLWGMDFIPPQARI